LHDRLVASAARLIGRRGTVGLTVREIAEDAGLAQGALYNHFADKDELIVLGLREHVHSVLAGATVPEPGSATVESNLRGFANYALSALSRLIPAFGGVIGHPDLISRFAGHFRSVDGGIPGVLVRYLEAEQELGRVAPDADVQAAADLIMGACHQQILPALFQGSPLPTEVRPGFVDGLVRTVLNGIAPR
jgi:AcrR family transcriptional regulator